MVNLLIGDLRWLGKESERSVHSMQFPLSFLLIGIVVFDISNLDWKIIVAYVYLYRGMHFPLSFFLTGIALFDISSLDWKIISSI